MGWVFVPVNRVLSSTVTCTVGSVGTGQRLQNLYDPAPWNGVSITPSSNQVQLKIQMSATPTDTADGPYLVNCLGFVNHNLNAATIELRYGHTTYASATTQSDTPFTLTNAVYGHSNILLLFDKTGTPSGSGDFGEVSSEFWHVDISNKSDATEIGNLVLGYAFDVGEPLRPERFGMVPYADPVVTLSGKEIYTRISEVIDTRVVTFRDPTQLDNSRVYDRTIDATNKDVYPNLWRLFRSRYDIDNKSGSSNRTGIAPAGGQTPIMYREGGSTDYSSVGRPAFYGFCTMKLNRNIAIDDSELTVSIRDVSPKAWDIAPAI